MLTTRRRELTGGLLPGFGRGHVFTDAGRHVTSLRLRAGEAERKLESDRWAHLETADVVAFREGLETILRRTGRRDSVGDSDGAG